MSCDGRKWECQYCTFLNYKTALKCTMCRSQKPLEVIEEGAPPPMTSISSFALDEPSIFSKPPTNQILNHSPPSHPEYDFSSLIERAKEASKDLVGSSVTLTSSPKHFGVIGQERAANKSKEIEYGGGDAHCLVTEVSEKPTIKLRRNTWACPHCSTLNWNISSSCKQCNTNCSNSPEEYGDGDNSSIKSEPLTISELAESVNNRDAMTKQHNTSPVLNTSRINRSPQGAEKYISSSNSPTNNSNANQEKWTCRSCTYDNWPRSVKCIMCMCPISCDQSIALGTNEVKQLSSIYSQSNLCESVIAPALSNLSLAVGNNRGSNFDSSGYNNVDENAVNTGYTDAMRLRLFNNEMDRRWLDACCGAVDGNIQAVSEYLSSGGDPTRQMTEPEVMFLGRPSAFDVGFTLIHLALRFHQEDVLATLLSQVDDGGPPVVKRVPSYAAPSVANEIRRHVMASIRQRKGPFRCHFTSEIVTFTLPSEIDDMSPETQETIFDEILDRDVQKELENGQIINWSLEVADQLNSRLYALWNRSAGDCLLDSVLQATWGIFDRENGLRRALSDSLHDCATQFYQRWKDSELLHARLLNFSLNEAQCTADWTKLLSLASQPGSSLEQLHIFALAHILRRPIIVYGVKYVKSFRGETLGFARYEGVYLPFLWEPSFCWRSPITLGYTRGHFSALIPMEPDCDPMARVDSAAQLDADDINARSVYLPLSTVEGALLPVQFLTQSEIGTEEFILSQWLDVSVTDNGVMVARQRIQKRPLLVAQMVEEWLNHYRRLGQLTATPYMRQSTATCYSSEGESDND